MVGGALLGRGREFGTVQEGVQRGFVVESHGEGGAKRRSGGRGHGGCAREVVGWGGGVVGAHWERAIGREAVLEAN